MNSVKLSYVKPNANNNISFLSIEILEYSLASNTFKYYLLAFSLYKILFFLKPNSGMLLI